MLEEWCALKAKVGMGCSVLDRVLENTAAVSTKNAMSSSCQRKSGRFYNIYMVVTATMAWPGKCLEMDWPHTYYYASAQVWLFSS